VKIKPDRTLATELRAKQTGKLPKKGTFNRKHIIDEDVGNYNWMLHATKGWRRRKICGAAA
jgi:hypothetical protein